MSFLKMIPETLGCFGDFLYLCSRIFGYRYALNYIGKELYIVTLVKLMLKMYYFMLLLFLKLWDNYFKEQHSC